MIKAILFDADGVVIRNEYFSTTFSREYGTSLEVLDSFFNGDFLDCVIGKKDLKEELDKRRESWGWSATVDALLSYWFNAERNVDMALVSVIQLLRSSGIRCYLATNQEKYRTQYLIDEMGFADIFDTIFASCNLGVRKPQPEFYQSILAEIGNPLPEEVLYFDDSQPNIDTALNLGIRSEFYTTFEDGLTLLKRYIPGLNLA